MHSFLIFLLILFYANMLLNYKFSIMPIIFLLNYLTIHYAYATAKHAYVINFLKLNFLLQKHYLLIPLPFFYNYHRLDPYLFYLMQSVVIILLVFFIPVLTTNKNLFVYFLFYLFLIYLIVK